MHWSREDLLTNTSTFDFSPPNYLPLERVMEFSISCLLPYKCYRPNIVKISPIVLEKTMLTDDDGRQPITIGHLSDSGDLKSYS